MKIYYNYAHGCCYNAQKRAVDAASKNGSFDKVFAFGKSDLEPVFYQQNKTILDKDRGAGFWIWKYHLACRLLSDDQLGQQIPEGSYVCYGDTDLFFEKPIDLIIACMEKDNEQVATFRCKHTWKLKVYVKRDALILLGGDDERYLQSMHRAAGFWVFKKGDFARQFFSQMTLFALDPRVIDDSHPNQLGQPNYPEFRQHGHDEPLLTIMSMKNNLYSYRWPGFDIGEDWAHEPKCEVCNVWWGDSHLYTTHQNYPPLIPGKSAYPRMFNHTHDHD